MANLRIGKSNSNNLMAMCGRFDEVMLEFACNYINNANAG